MRKLISKEDKIFVAGASGMVGKSIKETLVLANKVAGISTTKLGAGNSMPFINDLK